MEVGHSAWISWLLSGRLETFYDGLRWPSWREDAAALEFTQGITVYPFLGRWRPMPTSRPPAGGRRLCARSSAWRPTSLGRWARLIRGSSVTCRPAMCSWQNRYRRAIVDSFWQRMSIMRPWNIAQI
ncbi:DUF2625 family protein [Streptomyces mirabilis]|uniref:DUF2625 family protein n=1 Tax=Streptomyces mirabilis TaxID=68239 RepID=UPI003693BC4E